MSRKATVFGSGKRLEAEGQGSLIEISRGSPARFQDHRGAGGAGRLVEPSSFMRSYTTRGPGSITAQPL